MLHDLSIARGEAAEVNTIHSTPLIDGNEGPAPASTCSAKARLLMWAEEHDARKARARASMGSILAGGALAALGGVAIARMLVPPRWERSLSPAWVRNAGGRAARWALVARAGTWLVPFAIKSLSKRTLPSVLN
jgi:hypothetical protein